MQIHPFYDEKSGTFTYLIVDERTQHCAIVDSVLNYDADSATASHESADEIIDFIRQNKLCNQWILETHIHADHITAARYLQQQVGGKIAMGSGIRQVLPYWVAKFETEADTPMDASQFDKLFDDGDCFTIGSLVVTVWHTPGHTPACASYLIEDSIFVGDTLFAPHLGTARCDFPGGSAEALFNTVKRFYTLPHNTKVYLAHDYPKEGEQPTACLSMARCIEENKHIRNNTQLSDYVAQRQARDKTLAVPKLLLPAIQANMRNGDFGAESSAGQRFIKLPVTVN